MQIEVKRMSDFKAKDWWQIAKERVQVFIVERILPFQEFDEADLTAYHIVLRDDDGTFIGYCRINNQDQHYADLDHLMILRPYRLQGIGAGFVNMVINIASRLCEGKTVRIKIKSYMVDFFTKVGFRLVENEEHDGFVTMTRH